MIRRIWSSFVFEQYATSAEHLALYRCLLAAWLLAFRVPQFQWIEGYPSFFLHPPLGLTAFFFTGFPPAWVFDVIDVVSIGALVFLLVGRATLAAAAVFLVCQILGQSWAYSFGKINHEILLVLTPAFLALAERESRTTKTGWPLALFAFTISVAMFTAAAAKAATGWLNPSVSGTLGHGIANALGAAGRDNAAWQLAMSTLPLPAWKAMDIMAVGMEASFVFTVFRRRAFLVSLSLACLFHLGVATLMRIQFVNIFAYGVYVPWASVVAGVGLTQGLLRRQASLRDIRVPLVALAALAFGCVSIAWRNPVSFLWSSVSSVSASLLATWIAALAGGLYLASGAARLVQRTPRRSDAADGPLILFDGVCGLCNSWVDFILSVDTGGRYRFAPLQSPMGGDILTAHGFSPDYRASIVLVRGDRVFVRSAAILEILRGLGGLWQALSLARILPERWRDRCYDAVAENRYEWFGRRETCRIPTPAERSRFMS